MFPDSVLKSFSIIAPVLVFATGLFILWRWRMGNFATISRHAGQNKAAYTMLAASLVVAGAMYYLFLWDWVGLHYSLPFFKLIVILAMIGLVVVALVPAKQDDDSSTKVHYIAGMLIMTLMYIVGWLFLLGGETSHPGTIIAVWSFVILSSLAGLLLEIARHLRRFALAFEIAYAILFWVMVVCITYLR